MDAQRLGKFAKATLEIYMKEGTFEVEFVSEAEAQQAVFAFEQLGCQVKRKPYSTVLIITAPVEAKFPSDTPGS